MVNHKGQAGIVSYFTTVFLFVVLWALFLGAHFSEWGERAVTTNGLTGIEAFLFMNINLVIFFCLFVSSAGALYMARGAVQ